MLLPHPRGIYVVILLPNSRNNLTEEPLRYQNVSLVGAFFRNSRPKNVCYFASVVKVEKKLVMNLPVEVLPQVSAVL